MAYPVTLNGQTFTAADFDGQAYVTGLPAIMEQAATHWGTIFSSTSTTSVVIGTGSKSLTVQTNKPYQVGTPLRIANTAAPSTNWMDGVVTSYTAGTGALVVNVVGIAGSGTFTAWSINLGGGGYAVSSPVTIAQGGTGATTASAALTALGAVPLEAANKDACRVASTANVTLTAPGTAIDGITLTTGDRVMLKNQTAQAENGIYNFQGSASTMTRATDMNTWAAVPNAFTSVEEGTANQNTVWICQNTATGTLNTTAITWQLVSNAQVAALAAVATTGFVNRTGTNTFSTTASATAATASTLVARDASADITTNNLVVGNGTVGAPALRASADTNTGVRFTGSDGLLLVTAGTDRVNVTANGDVGINYSPGAVTDMKWLAVKGPNSGQGYAALRVEDGLNSKQATLQIQGANGDVVVGCEVSNTTGAIAFHTGGTARTTITAAGEVEFGQNTSATPGYSGNTTVGAALWNGRLFMNADDFGNWNLQRPGGVTTGTFVAFLTQGTAIGNIGTNGTTTSYNTTSDYRLKQDAEPLTGALDRLDQLQPKRFRFKSDPTMAKVDGFFAHEAAEVVPESVTGEQDGEDFGGNPEYQAMDASKLVPLLVAAVQELRAEFNAYKTAHP